MQKSLIILLLLFASHLTFGQKIDYLDIRKAKYLSDCGSDSQAVRKALSLLKTVDPNRLNKNIDAYYHDLGFIYYKMSLISRNTKYMDTAVSLYKKAIKINGTNYIAMWDCAVALVFSKNCKEGMKYLKEYIKLAPPAIIDTESANGMRNICSGKPIQ